MDTAMTQMRPQALEMKQAARAHQAHQVKAVDKFQQVQQRLEVHQANADRATISDQGAFKAFASNQPPEVRAEIRDYRATVQEAFQAGDADMKALRQQAPEALKEFAALRGKELPGMVEGFPSEPSDPVSQEVDILVY